MSRNGSGIYNLPTGNPVVTGTTITSNWANTTLSDISTALTGSVAADGQTPITGDLQMGGNKITGMGTPTSAQDAATKAYVDAGVAALGTMSTQNANNVAITGGTITGLSSALPVASGGTGVTTSTGSGANVLGTSPTIATPTITSPTITGTITDGTYSTTVAKTAQGTAKAWVLFDGTSGASPVIRGSFNVASVTRNSTGNYTIAFTTAMANANYAVIGTSQTKQTVCGAFVSIYSPSSGVPTQYNTSGVCIATTESTNGTVLDLPYNSVAIFN